MSAKGHKWERDARLHKQCEICGCTKDKYYYTWSKEGRWLGKVVCMKHYQQLRLYGKITDTNMSTKYMDRVCSHCGSEKDVIYDKKTKNMLCRIHYQQLNRLGGIMERTKYDKNSYEIDEEKNIAIIQMYNSEKEPTEKFIIDLEDLGEVIKYKWYLDTHGYPTASKVLGFDKKHTTIQLFLKGEKGKIVDHINRNKLDNRKENLRVVDKKINALNTNIRTSNKSGVTGVSYTKSTDRWRAYINIDGKRVELGYYKNKEDAIKSRLQKEFEILGDTSPQKNLFKKYRIGEKNE